MTFGTAPFLNAMFELGKCHSRPPKFVDRSLTYDILDKTNVPLIRGIYAS
jgi:hypothetical protein